MISLSTRTAGMETCKASSRSQCLRTSTLMKSDLRRIFLLQTYRFACFLPSKNLQNIFSFGRQMYLLQLATVSQFRILTGSMERKLERHWNLGSNWAMQETLSPLYHLSPWMEGMLAQEAVLLHPHHQLHLLFHHQLHLHHLLPLQHQHQHLQQVLTSTINLFIRFLAFPKTI